MLQSAVSATGKMVVATTNEFAHLVVDHTIGRLLNTNPDKMH